MKYIAQIDSIAGGVITIHYKIKGFDPSGNEQLRISLDGQKLLLDSRNSDDFVQFKSEPVPFGVHLFDISILSNFQTVDLNFKSTAQVLISRATFEGTSHGGAQECLKCPA